MKSKVCFYYYNLHILNNFIGWIHFIQKYIFHDIYFIFYFAVLQFATKIAFDAEILTDKTKKNSIGLFGFLQLTKNRLSIKVV